MYRLTTWLVSLTTAAVSTAAMSVSAQVDGECSPTHDADAYESVTSSYVKEYLALNPLEATLFGFDEFNDKFRIKISTKYRIAARSLEERYVDALCVSGVIDPEWTIRYEIFEHERRKAIERFAYPDHLLPLRLQFSLPEEILYFGGGGDAQPFNTVADYDNWLSRMSKIEAWFDQAIANYKLGVESGIVHPRVITEALIARLDDMLKSTTLDESVLFEPIKNMPATVGDKDRVRLTQAFHQAFDEGLRPAYVRLRDYLRDEYLAESRSTIGLSALNNGLAWYEYLLYQHTDMKLSAAELHAGGLLAVRNLANKVTALMGDDTGNPSFPPDYDRSLIKKILAERRKNLPTYDDPDTMLADYRQAFATASANLSKVVEGDVPPATVELVPEPVRSAAPAAFYRPLQTAEGQRGIFYLNPQYPQAKYLRDSLVAHELVPGHHYQIMHSMNFDTQYDYDKLSSFTAFTEGWGVYAETLGSEIGLYEEPDQFFGLYDSLLLRAVRLVVDTGIHAQGWSQSEAEQYMIDHTAMPVEDIKGEVLRYIADPGQSVSYFTGYSVIKEASDKARMALGASNFKIAEWHSYLLQYGAVPTYMIDGILADFVESKRAEAISAPR